MKEVNFEELLERRLLWLKTHHYQANTLQGQRGQLRLFFSWCQQRDIHEVSQLTPPLLEAFQRFLYYSTTLHGKRRHVRTQHGLLGTVRGFCRWLHQQGFLLFDPSSGLQYPKLPDSLPLQTLSLAEIERLLRLPDLNTPVGLRDRAVLETLYATAMRCAEALQLTASDLQRDSRVVWIRGGKGNKDRVVPITQRALDWIERYERHARPVLLAAHPCPSLFLSQEGETLASKTLRTRVTHYLQTAVPQKRGSCHLIRHSVATLMLQNGCDSRYLQELLGHASLKSTQIYTRVGIPGLQQAYAKTHPSLHASSQKRNHE